MGWFTLGKRIVQTAEQKTKQDKAAEKRAEAIAKLPTLDNDLPLGLHIGRLFGVPRADFAVLQDSIIPTPNAAELPVQGVSRVKLSMNPELPVYRYYTDLGLERLGHGKAFLEYRKQMGENEEIIYYQFLHRINPESEDERNVYRGEEAGLGEIDFFLSGEQLNAIGLPDTLIDRVLAGQDSLHYQRDVAGRPHIPPFHAIETRLDDRAGVAGMRQQIRFMPYVRNLPDGNREHLLISYEELESFDGEQKKHIHVDFMLGLSLDTTRLKIY